MSIVRHSVILTRNLYRLRRTFTVFKLEIALILFAKQNQENSTQQLLARSACLLKEFSFISVK